MDGPPRRPRVTVINDSEEILRLAEQLLDEHGPYETTVMRAAEATVEHVIASAPELVVIDVGSRRSAELGHDLITDAPAELRDVPVILTTPAGSLSGRLLERAGARVHHLPKPFTAQALEDLVRGLLPRDA